MTEAVVYPARNPAQCQLCKMGLDHVGSVYHDDGTTVEVLICAHCGFTTSVPGKDWK